MPPDIVRVSNLNIFSIPMTESGTCMKFDVSAKLFVMVDIPLTVVDIPDVVTIPNVFEISNK